MSPEGVVRLNPNGSPEGSMEACSYIDPSHVLEGKAEERAQIFLASPSEKFLVGVWECSPCKEKVEDYPFHECCFVLQGSVIVTDEEGRSETFSSGDAFTMRKGFQGLWHMTEHFKKYFIAYTGD